MNDAIDRLEREMGIVMRRATASAARVAERVHPDLDASAYPLLVRIAQVPGIRPSELADAFGIGRATTSRQVARLVDLGLVTRSIDPNDCRGQSLRLTEDGRARLIDARDRRRRWFTKILADWPEDDVANLAGLLELFAEAVEADQASRRAQDPID